MKNNKKTESIEIKYVASLGFNAKNAFHAGLDKKEATKQRKYYQNLQKKELIKRDPKIYLPFLVIRGKKGEIAYMKDDRSNSKMAHGRLALEVPLSLSAQERNKWGQIAANVFKTAYFRECEISDDSGEFKEIVDRPYQEFKFPATKGVSEKARFRTFEDKEKWGSCTSGPKKRAWRNKEMRIYWKEMKGLLQRAKVVNVKIWLREQKVWEDSCGRKKLSSQTIIKICQGGK
ncbi:hypothetical protein KJ641_00005 [Patescibacteria group bacterium]|nr:hypothetical protein [Patescibacteria group bacterium]